MSWFVQVQNQNYGPYTDTQMQAFVQEGRVNGSSLLTNDVNSGFFNASGFDVFKYWSGEQQIAVSGGGPRAYQPTPIAPAVATPVHQSPLITPQAVHRAPEGQAQPSPSSVFLVMAEINSEGTMAFLQALQRFGQAERISDTIWLLRSQASVEQLRNALSQTLNRQDRLFLLDSRANKPAWFNIGADLDHRIRDLWEDDES
jgi:hypothetical protein